MECVNSMNKILIFLIMFLLLSNIVKAFGVMQSSSYVEVPSGGTAKFVIFVWNEINCSIPVEIKLRNTPKDFLVYIIPNKLVLNFSKTTVPTKDTEYVNTKFGLMKTTPINVLVNVPSSAKPGNYSILIDILAGSSTTGISALIEKTIKFDLNVQPRLGESSEQIKTIEIKERNLHTANETAGRIENLTTRTPIVIDYHTIFILVFTFVIILVSLLVYKYA